MTVQQQTTEQNKAQEMASQFASSSAPAKKASQSENPLKKVHSRFGEIEINLEKQINFPHGILGLPAQLNFCLADFPREGFGQFKLLQSVDDSELCFITIPTDHKDCFIKENDLVDACNVMEINPDSVLVLFIVTTHRSPNQETRISVNAKAPILVNTETHAALQYVFNNKDYEIRHMIS